MWAMGAWALPRCATVWLPGFVPVLVGIVTGDWTPELHRCGKRVGYETLEPPARNRSLHMRSREFSPCNTD